MLGLVYISVLCYNNIGYNDLMLWLLLLFVKDFMMIVY